LGLHPLEGIRAQNVKGQLIKPLPVLLIEVVAPLPERLQRGIPVGEFSHRNLPTAVSPSRQYRPADHGVTRPVQSVAHASPFRSGGTDSCPWGLHWALFWRTPPRVRGERNRD